MAQWEDQIKVIDKVTRDRLFILTVAAEKGWAVGSDLVARMRGIDRWCWCWDRSDCRQFLVFHCPLCQIAVEK